MVETDGCMLMMGSSLSLNTTLELEEVTGDEYFEFQEHIVSGKSRHRLYFCTLAHLNNDIIPVS